MLNLSKTLTISILLIISVGVVSVVADLQIDPLPDDADKFKVDLETTLPEAGKSEVELLMDHPEIRLKKWDGQVNLGISYDKVQTQGEKPLLTNRVEWKDGAQEVHAYPLEASAEVGEDGGFEIEVILNEKPDTNVFEFAIDGAENLDFFYQYPLWQDAGLRAPTVDCTDTQCPNDTGGISNRPENVVGSYAVYHKTKANHRVGDTNYATGKAYHIYRPKAIDGKGEETWAELLYKDGTLIVTVPQKFLDDAVYPVIVDPTLGYTSIGGTALVGAGANFAQWSEEVASQNGTITKYTWYGSDPEGTADIEGGLWNATTLALIAGSICGPTLNITSTAGWLDINCVTGPAIVNGTRYATGYILNEAATAYYDTSSGNGGYDLNSYATPTDLSAPLGNTTFRFSMYATYTISNTATVNLQGQLILQGQMIIQ